MNEIWQRQRQPVSNNSYDVPCAVLIGALSSQTDSRDTVFYMCGSRAYILFNLPYAFGSA